MSKNADIVSGTSRAKKRSYTRQSNASQSRSQNSVLAPRHLAADISEAGIDPEAENGCVAFAISEFEIGMSGVI